MEKFITDERTGLQYELVGDYYLIAGEDEPEGRPIGIWGAGRGYVLSTGKTTCRKGGCNGITQSGKPNAVGAKDEQRPQHRYGGCFKRFNLRITNIYRKAAVKRQRLFFFGK